MSHEPSGSASVQSDLSALRSSEAFRGPVDHPDGRDSNGHLILLYETQDEQFDAVVPFVRQGLRQGERCLYIVHDNSVGELLAAFRAGGIDVDAALDSGALTIHTAEEVYLQDGTFDPDAMVSYLEDSIEEALGEYEGFRATGEMTWILDAETPLRDVAEYEDSVDRLYSRENCLGLCQYNRDRFPSETIRRIVESHPHVVYDNTVSRNIYYTPPDELFSAEGPAREIDRMLSTTVDRTRAEATLRERERFLRDLYDVTSDRGRSFEERIEAMLDLGCDFFGLDIGSLTHLPDDDSEYEVDVIVGPISDEFEGTPPVQPEPGCFCRQALARDRPVGTTDVRDVGWDHDLLYDKYGLVTYFGVKVTVDADPYGTLWFGDTEPRRAPFSDAEYTFLELMGRWVSYEIERREREQQLRQQKESLAQTSRNNALVRDLVRAFVAGETVTEMKQQVCDRLTASDFYRAAWISDRPLPSQQLTPQACAGIEEESVRSIVAAGGETAQGIAKRALDTGEIQVCQRVSADASACRQQLQQYGIESALAVPIVHAESRYGVLAVYADRPNAFGEHRRTLFDDFGETLGFAITAARRKQTLATDEVVELDARFDHPDHFLSQVTAATDAAVTVEGVFDHSGDAQLVYATVTDVSPETILDRAAAADTIADARLVKADGQESLVELVDAGPSVTAAFAEYGAAVTTYTAREGRARVTATLPQKRDVRTVVEGVRSTFPDLTVVAKRTVDRPLQTQLEFRATLTTRLTDKQRTTLRAAYFAGYFDRPRASTGDEIAERLDISSSTFHQHLRIGLRKLLSAAFDGSSVR